jgi:hypothetical protein
MSFYYYLFPHWLKDELCQVGNGCGWLDGWLVGWMVGWLVGWWTMI